LGEVGIPGVCSQSPGWEGTAGRAGFSVFGAVTRKRGGDSLAKTYRLVPSFCSKCFCQAIPSPSPVDVYGTQKFGGYTPAPAPHPSRAVAGCAGRFQKPSIANNIPHTEHPPPVCVVRNPPNRQTMGRFAGIPRTCPKGQAAGRAALSDNLCVP
jgi:hypothetical protein